VKPTFLIVDDEQNIRESFRQALQDDYNLVFAQDAKSALRVLKTQTFDLCVLDSRLADGGGMELLRQIKRRDENTDVVMAVAAQDIDATLDGFRLGAYDYITKPYKPDELDRLVRRVMVKRALEKENRVLREEMGRRSAVGLIGNSEKLREMKGKISNAAKTLLPVLLTGEMGCGFEEVAREIHAQSASNRGPFITVPCAASGKGNTEGELYGKSGDETRNKPSRVGKLEFAEGGTLFLEQVDRLAPEIQDKLFKALSGRKMLRAGSQAVLPVNVRVVASLSPECDLNKEKTALRKEFHHFLSAFVLAVPPLRERREDIPELIRYFLKSSNRKARVPVKNIQNDAMQFLTRYGWPGNLREMENSIELMTLFAGKETLAFEDIPLDILVKQIDLARTKEEAKLSLRRVRRQFERQYIRKVLEKTRGNQTRAAATLGLHRNTLIWKLRKLNLKDDYLEFVKKRRDNKMGFRGL
jgi:DNA-binding NtrC family response regulator